MGKNASRCTVISLKDNNNSVKQVIFKCLMTSQFFIAQGNILNNLHNSHITNVCEAICDKCALHL
jgi:hypothetical protein